MHQTCKTGRYLVNSIGMQEIPSDTMKQILDLRRQNGLEATEAALKKDLGKAKWSLTPKSRYRLAGRSPVYISGKYLTSSGKDPLTGESASEKGTTANTKKRSTFVRYGKEINERDFYKGLHERGFEVKLTQNLLTGEINTALPSSISELQLKFQPIPASSAGIYVSQTSPEIQMSMTLDTFLNLAGIKS